MTRRKRLHSWLNLEPLEVRDTPAVGVLDAKFNADGLAIFDPTGDEYGHAVAIDTKGRIVVAGYTTAGLTPNALGDDFEVIRLTPEGKLDPTFGSGGVQTIDFSVNDIQATDRAGGVAVDAADNVIVVGTSSTATQTRVGVVKLTSGGTLDGAFVGGGKTTFDYVAGVYASADAVAIDPSDGDIVIAGSSGLSVASQFAIARLTSTGGFEGTFTGGGKFAFPITATSIHHFATDVTLDPTGRIVVAGKCTDTGAEKFAVARLSAGGVFDGTFTGGGKFGFNFPGSTNDSAAAVDTDAAGNIYMAGYSVPPASPSRHAVAKLTAAGTPAPGFGAGGFFTTSFPGNGDVALGIGVHVNGKVAITGYSTGPGGNLDFDVIQLTTTGALDPTFNAAGPSPGKLAFDLGANQSDLPRELVIDPNGRVVVAGLLLTSPGIAVARVAGQTVNLSATITDGLAAATAGGLVTYTATFTNTGPDTAVGAPVAVNFPAEFLATPRTFTSTATGGATGNTASGIGSPADTLTLPPGATVTYTVTARVAPTATGSVGATASIGVPVGVLDPNTADNAATDTDAVTHLWRPLAAGGAPDGSAVVYAPDPATGLYLPTPAATLRPFGTVPANLRTATADVNDDGIADTILVTGPGTPIRVAVVSGKDGSVLVSPFDPFGGNFTGGGFVTAADFDRDGRSEFVVTPDQGGGPRISIFSMGAGGAAALRANFLTIEESFRGGARPGAGDINGDGVPDLVVSAGFLGGPRIVVLNGQRVLSVSNFTSDADKLVGDFFAFSPELRNGAYVDVGDVNGDGFGDLVFGAGPGGGPEIRVVSGQQLLSTGSGPALATAIADFFLAGDLNNRGGVRVAVTDVDLDGKADVVAGTGGGQASFVRVYPGKNFIGPGEPGGFQDLDPFAGAALADGVYVG